MARWIGQILDVDPIVQIVLDGGIMGATVMMTTGWPLPMLVRAAIEDCGYSSIWEEFAYQLHKVFHLSEFPWLYVANMLAKKRGFFV